MREYDGKNVYESGDFRSLDELPAGTLVSGEMANFFLNVLPPASMKCGYFQLGEPHEHRIDENTGAARATFATFVGVEDGTQKSIWDDDSVWVFRGYCFRGEENERGKPIPYVA